MNTAENKFAFVTGTSSGLGRAVAGALLKRGWEVAGAARRNCGITSENYAHLKVDLGEPGIFVEKLSEFLKDKICSKKYERIALVNNAASAGGLTRIENLDPRNLDKICSLNFIAPLWLTGFFHKNRPIGSRLRIMDISSAAAHSALPGLADYCGTKAALSLAGKVFAEENRDDKNLAVMSYEPGTVDTEMQASLKDVSPEQFPSYNLFRTIREKNMLVSPEIVAEDMADFLEANTYGYSEKRFDPGS